MRHKTLIGNIKVRKLYETQDLEWKHQSMDLCIGDKTANIKVYKLYETQGIYQTHRSMKIVMDIRLETSKYRN